MFEYNGKTYEGAQELLDNYRKLDEDYWHHRKEEGFEEKWQEAWDAMFAYWMKLLKDATVGMKDVSEDDYDEIYYGLLNEIEILAEDIIAADSATDYEVTDSDLESSYEERTYYFEDFAPSKLVFGIDAGYSPYRGCEFNSLKPTAYLKVPVTKYEYRPVDTVESDEDE